MTSVSYSFIPCKKTAVDHIRCATSQPCKWVSLCPCWLLPGGETETETSRMSGHQHQFWPVKICRRWSKCMKLIKNGAGIGWTVSQISDTWLSLFTDAWSRYGHLRWEKLKQLMFAHPHCVQSGISVSLVILGGKTQRSLHFSATDKNLYFRACTLWVCLCFSVQGEHASVGLHLYVCGKHLMCTWLCEDERSDWRNVAQG